MKTCTVCKNDKLEGEFYPRESRCNLCCVAYSRAYKLANKETIKINRKYNKAQIKKQSARYYQKNKEKQCAEKKAYRAENKDKIAEYKEKNKEKRKVRRDSNRSRNNENAKKRIASNPLFRLAVNLRSRTRSAFKRKGWVKSSSAATLLGTDYEAIKLHIEKQFTTGMTWDNYGEWELDHITALVTAENEIDLRELCKWTNLQPLWSTENRSKGSKLNWVKK